MSKLKKYNLSGNQIGEVSISDHLANAEANGQMVKDYIVALRANARQWNACTKTRAEVNHSNKKPHPQKGQGRARQGQLSTPQYKGGGRVFGPRPKTDQHIRINKKERRAAIRFLIAEKIREEKLHVIDETAMDAPKTKTIAQFLKGSGLSGRRILFLGEGSYLDLGHLDMPMRMAVPSDKHVNFAKSLRNVPKAEFALAQNISGYDVIRAHEIVMTEAALQEIEKWLG